MAEEQTPSGIPQATDTLHPSEDTIKVEGAEEATSNAQAIWKTVDESLVDAEGRMRIPRGAQGSDGWEFYYTETTPDHLVLQKKVPGTQDVFGARMHLFRRYPGYVDYVDVSNLQLDEDSLKTAKGNSGRGVGLEFDLEGDHVKSPVVKNAVPGRVPSDVFGRGSYFVEMTHAKVPFEQKHFDQFRTKLSEAARNVTQIAGQIKSP